MEQIISPNKVNPPDILPRCFKRMSNSTIIRCLLVSIFISIVAAILSTTVLVTPEEGKDVPDLSYIDTNENDVATMIDSIPM